MVRALFVFLPWFLAAVAKADAFDDQINDLLAKSKAAGVAIGYAERGKIRFAKGYGFANLEHKVKMRPDHVHELASVSKQFTAACILQLNEAGKLSLDDSISKFFPDAHEDWKKVQVKHLLNHTAGLPDYLTVVSNPALEFTKAQLVDSIRGKPLKHPAATKFEYSNSAYMLLGFVVEEVSGMRLGDYMKKNLFDPAGMKTAVWNDTRAIVPNRADGYTLRNGQISKEGFTSTSLSQTADGQVMASVLDLISWDAALHGEKVLSRKAQALMNTPVEPHKEGGPGFYGFGVNVSRSTGRLVQGHGGGWMGTNTFLIRHVDDGKCLVILFNSDMAPMAAVRKLCEERFLDSPTPTGRGG